MAEGDHPALRLAAIGRDGRRPGWRSTRSPPEETLCLPRAGPCRDRARSRRGAHGSTGETGGQPFYLAETLKVLRGLAADSSASGGCRDPGARRAHVAQPLPPGAREVIAAQLGRLAPPAAALLVAGAVLGQDATFAQLCQVAGIGEGAWGGGGGPPTAQSNEAGERPGGGPGGPERRPSGPHEAGAGLTRGRWGGGTGGPGAGGGGGRGGRRGGGAARATSRQADFRRSGSVAAGDTARPSADRRKREEGRGAPRAGCRGGGGPAAMRTRPSVRAQASGRDSRDGRRRRTDAPPARGVAAGRRTGGGGSVSGWSAAARRRRAGMVCAATLRPRPPVGRRAGAQPAPALHRRPDQHGTRGSGGGGGGGGATPLDDRGGERGGGGGGVWVLLEGGPGGCEGWGGRS